MGTVAASVAAEHGGHEREGRLGCLWRDTASACRHRFSSLVGPLPRSVPEPEWALHPSVLVEFWNEDGNGGSSVPFGRRGWELK